VTRYAIAGPSAATSLSGDTERSPKLIRGRTDGVVLECADRASEPAERQKARRFMALSSWKTLITVFDTISAQVLVDRLNAEGVPTQLKSDSSLFGVARSCEILVPEEVLWRARRLMATEPFSDSELSSLATGEPDSEA
jgi:Putative prokaryotic signal transducing protein